MTPSSNLKYLFLFPLIFLFCFASPVFAIDFNAYWTYAERGGDDKDTVRQFLQRYSIGFGTDLNYTVQPTHAISASANVGYTIRQSRYISQDLAQSSSGTTTSTEQLLTPNATVNLVNDIFMASLSGTSYLSDRGSNKLSNNSWNASLRSAWDIPLVPMLGFIHSEEVAPRDDLAIELTGRRNKNTSVTLDWDLILADFFYSYNKNIGVGDEFDNTFFETNSHFGKFQTFGSYWNNRIRLGFSQQFRYSTSSFGSGNQGEQGSFLFPLEPFTLSSITNPATLPDPLPGDSWPDEDVNLTFNNELRDRIFDIVALTVLPNLRGNFGINLDFRQQIDMLRLYLLDPLSTLTEEQAALLQWDLYVRNLSDTGWTLVAEDIPATYDFILKRFQLAINRVDTEIMVTVINVGGDPLDFTELEAFTLLSQSNAESSTTNYTTNFSLGYRITNSMNFNTAMTYEHFGTESGDLESTNDKSVVSASLNWRPVPYVSPSIRFSEFREKQTLVTEKIIRTYSLGVPTTIIPTVHLNFNISHLDRFTGEQKTYASNRYSLSSKLPIYPDLDASWFLSFTDSERLEVGDDLIDSRNVFNSRLNFTAKLHRYLSSDILTNYTNSETDTGGSQTAQVTLAMRYRPSDILAVVGDYTTFYLDNDSVSRLNLNLGLTLFRTSKGRMIFRYQYIQSDTKFNAFYAVGSWDISRHLTFTTNANYRIADQASYNFVLRLALWL